MRDILRALRLLSRQNALILARLNVVQAGSVWFYTFIDGKNQRIENMFLKDSQNLPLSVQFKDQKGNAAPVDGAPQWSVSDPSLAVVEAAADGMSAVLKPVGPLGAFKVQVSADADLGQGQSAIIGELDVEIVGGDAVSVQIAAGSPVDA